MAVYYNRENKPDLALNYITHARELSPDATIYRVIQGKAFKRSNDPESALRGLVTLDEAQKREPGVMPLIAECYGLLKRPADAAKMYVDASDSDQTQGEWAMQAALWLERVGDFKRGGEYARRAAALNVEGAAAVAARLK